MHTSLRRKKHRQKLQHSFRCCRTTASSRGKTLQGAAAAWSSAWSDGQMDEQIYHQIDGDLMVGWSRREERRPERWTAGRGKYFCFVRAPLRLLSSFKFLFCSCYVLNNGRSFQIVGCITTLTYKAAIINSFLLKNYLWYHRLVLFHSESPNYTVSVSKSHKFSWRLGREIWQRTGWCIIWTSSNFKYVYLFVKKRMG